MVLGGCEVNLLELTNLYAALAGGGKLYPVQTRLDQSISPPQPLFSPGVAYVITEILTEVRRPDLPACWEFTTLPKVAWKTGTSYGHKDAWSIGYNPRYTVGVWDGNFSGAGRAGLNGAEKAAPLLFTIFTHLNSNTTVSWFTPPATVKANGLRRERPNARPFCSPLRTDYYLTDCSPDVECTIHQTYLLDPAPVTASRPIITRGPGSPKSGFICSTRPGLRRGLRQTDIRWKNSRLCSRNGKSSSPAVLRWCVRLRRIMFIIRRGFPWSIRRSVLKRRRATRCSASTGLSTGSFSVTANRVSGSFMPQPGRHRVVCQDDRGRSTEVMLEISD